LPLKAICRALLKGSLDTRWAALILVLVAWIIYQPALNRVFAADQLWYFAELDGRTSLLDGLRHYDYAATRRFWKGDDVTFRPLLFTWLAIGNRLFSYHHVWWNVANLALHTLVALFLFRLLLAVRPSPFALPAAVLFLALKPPLELVVWNHLGGYLLACIALLLGLRAFVRLTRDPASPHLGRTVAAFAAAFAVAGLLYEPMVLVSLAAAAIVLWIDWRNGEPTTAGKALGLLCPTLFFSALYVRHAFQVERLGYVHQEGAGGAFTFDAAILAIPHSVGMVAQWTLELAVPSALHLASAAFGRFGKTFSFSWTDPLHLFNAGLALLAIGLFARSVSRRQGADTHPILLLGLVGMVVYLFVLAFGRSRYEVFDITYYAYIFSLLLAVLMYSLVDFARLHRWTGAVAYIVIVGFAAMHAVESHATAWEVGRVNRYPSLYLSRVIRFVDAHKGEPDFTFMIRPHPESVDPDVYLVEGYPDDPTATSRHRRLTEILFAPYYNSTTPKYVLDSSAEALAPDKP